MGFSSVLFSSNVLAEGQAAGNPLSGLIIFVPMIALMYFMIIRPQRRQQREHMERIAALRSGDEVMTSGGIHGLITNVAERTVTLKIADNVKVKIEKTAIATITKKSGDPEEKPWAASEEETKA